MSHLYPPPARQVVVGVELLLELEGLVAGVRLPTSPPQAVRAVTWGHTERSEGQTCDGAERGRRMDGRGYGSDRRREAMTGVAGRDSLPLA